MHPYTIKKTPLSLLCAVIIAVSTFLSSPFDVNAAPIAFGGRSLTVIPCTCTPGFYLVTIGIPGSRRPPGIFTFMYSPSTFMYRNYNIFPPAWQLGLAGPPMVCLVYTGKACVPVGAGPVWIYDGTSLF